MVQPPERRAELLRHGVVDDGVDGAIGVDARPTEEQEPGVEVGRGHKGVDQHQSPVGHPEQGEQDDDHCQHLGDLRGNKLLEVNPRQPISFWCT